MTDRVQIDGREGTTKNTMTKKAKETIKKNKKAKKITKKNKKEK
jgi:hypothetical protein